MNPENINLPQILLKTVFEPILQLNFVEVPLVNPCPILKTCKATGCAIFTLKIPQFPHEICGI